VIAVSVWLMLRLTTSSRPMICSVAWRKITYNGKSIAVRYGIGKQKLNNN